MATFYISTTGNNANNGSVGSPWKTLLYACTNVRTSGDIIHINAGTYIESTQMDIALGVSIEGDGISSIIQSGVIANGNYLLLVESYATENVNGNQHISNVTFDGLGTTAYAGVSILNRGNVIVHHCIFKDFLENGIQFNNGAGQLAPVNMATGNQFYSNTVINCSRTTGTGEASYGRGGLIVGGQNGMLIHDNYLTQLGRGVNLNGYVIKYGGWGWNKGMKIYNNTIIKSVIDGGHYGFAVELMHEQGLEFYNNIVEGSLDVNFISKGTYAYGLYAHNNTFGPSALASGGSAFILEFDVADVIIVNNYIKNVGCPFHFSTRAGYNLSNNTFAYNICQNIGLIGSTAARAIRFIEVDTRASSSNGFYIYNNVFQSTTTAGAIGAWGIIMPTLTNGNTNNIVRNNIITGFTSGAIVANVATYINGLIISNNILYGNGNNNDPSYIGGSPLGYTISNQIKTNPLFISLSDFNLQSTSPAIAAGYNVGLITDYDNYAISNPPSIGVYEYKSVVVPKSLTILTAARIPKEVKKEQTDKWKAENLYVALFQDISNCMTDGISTYATLTNECSGAGYTAGGKILTTTSAYSGLNAVFGAANVTWRATSLMGLRYAVVYVKTGATIGLIRGVFDLKETRTITNVNMTIKWSISGLIKISEA